MLNHSNYEVSELVRHKSVLNNDNSNASGDNTHSSNSSNIIKPNKREPIPRTVWQIGIMMCLMNLSYVIAYSFSGLYLKHILGTATFSIAILEGLCETVSYLMKLLSGVISDFLRRRKVLMIIGYLFSVVSKPLLAFSNTFPFVLTSRMMERFGNGMQASPRDAIVADVAPKHRIGASYGLKRSLAYTGSFLGGFVGIISMKLTNNDYQKVFIIASIPAFIAFAILVFFLKEPKKQQEGNSTEEVKEEIKTETQQLNQQKSKFSFGQLKHLGKAFWAVIIVNTAFMLSRMNEQFLILRVNEGFVTDQALAPTVMIVMNLGAILASYPCGALGDKLNRQKMMFVSVILLVLSDLVMFGAASRVTMYSGICLWGMQMGASQNVFYSLIAENVPNDLRGTGLGIYWFVNAIMAFFADSIAGKIAEVFCLKYTFLSSGIFGILSLVTLMIVMSHLNKNSKSAK
ncbi:MAG: MFS transporter [Alphaproteobacteria bacterium]|nr:MFS transporter [Alphaproteobacteria bacterium]